jgi:hypothetical protein
MAHCLADGGGDGALLGVTPEQWRIAWLMVGAMAHCWA